ncbi:MAG: DUF3285 domain-containing protein [Cyanobacteria bacterium J06628_6]
MSETASSADTVANTPVSTAETRPAEPPPSFVKLAMRNMVKKGGKSLFHFGLTVTGLLTVLVGLAYLTR